MSLLSKDTDNIFGKRLRILRESIMNMNQKEFAAFLGAPQLSISAYEIGRNKPTIDVIITIADKCNVSIDWLCGRDKHAYLSSMGDLIGFFFDLYDSKEFSFKTKIQNRVDREGKDTSDDERNMVQLTFYYNDSQRNPKHIYSADVCQALETAQELHNELENYDCTQDYYDSRKAYFIEKYSQFPITLLDTSGLSEEERFRLRKERFQERMKEEEERLKNTKEE